LNGKIERTQQANKNELWSLIDLSDKALDLNALAVEWQNSYNKSSSCIKRKNSFQKLEQIEKLILFNLMFPKNLGVRRESNSQKLSIFKISPKKIILKIAISVIDDMENPM
jgi:hypothetical protein